MVEELIFNKIQNEEFREYAKVKKVLRDLESCLKKINACGEEKILVQQSRMNRRRRNWLHRLRCNKKYWYEKRLVRV